MNRSSIAEAAIFEVWRNFQEALKRVIAPLTREQLGLRLRPELRSVGEIAEHITYGRALWLKKSMPKARLTSRRCLHGTIPTTPYAPVPKYWQGG